MIAARGQGYLRLCPGVPLPVLGRTSARGRACLRPLLPNCRTNPRQIAEFAEKHVHLILTAAGEYAYRRPEDGAYVVPIGCLKP